MQRWHFNTNFIARLFGNKWSITVDDSGINLSQNGTVTLFSWNQFETPPLLQQTLAGGKISFVVNGNEHVIASMSYLMQSKLKSKLFGYWASANSDRLKNYLSRLDLHLEEQFLRDSHITDVKNWVRQEIPRWKGWREQENLSELAIYVADKLEQINAWSSYDINQIREEFVLRQQLKYRHFFESVESNPLTDKQQIACITDNDNNLLLAGAGTGKTSVMIGRTGYLIESKQAKASDILMLAYGNKAAKEMDERIKEKLSLDTVRASTFHSLGLKIIAEVDGKKPSLSAFESDSRAKEKWVNDTLEELMLDDAYREKLLEYFSSYYFVDKNPFDFETQGDYYHYLNDNDIRTFQGEQVKSYGELVIGNWLFRNGVRYQYEARYKFDVSTEEYRQYEPDFYLPDYDIYIEYYGIDEEGNTPPYINKETYLQSMEWKRKIHEQYETGYIELFYFQHRNGQLADVLQEQLFANDIQFDPIPDEDLLSSLKALGQVTELAKIFGALVDMYKAACLDSGRVDNVIQSSPDPKQTEKALELLYPLYYRYEQHLQNQSVIDFNDMIGKALRYVQTGQFVSPWKYLLVDEFQDISEPRARLVKALRDSLPGTSLFCVGDDWQAIYRFSGADVRLTTSFTEYFGSTSTTTLDMTFRFNSSIGGVATKFVTRNPVQLKKNIQSLVEVNRPAVSILRQGQNESGAPPLYKALNAIVNKIHESTKPNQNKVYLLARFWFQLPDRFELQKLNHHYPDLDIRALSFHASKGKEADYVVITGLTTGKNGFPSQKVTPPLVDALLPQGDDFEFAEERRLFYVAITRAKHRAYLLADMTDASEFVIELLRDKYPIETGEFGEITYVQKLFEQISCSKCKTGILKERRGPYGHFLSCSHFPRCKHKERPCDQCGSTMSSTIQPGYQVCINDECGDIRPLCQKCGGEMKLRHGRYGTFWGCTNYRKGSERGCNYTIKVVSSETD